MKRTLLILAVLLALLASACGRGSDAELPRAGRTSPPPGPVYCPLNGTETSREFDLERPALGVKIENSTGARPQAGLEAADIVYEELAEGGITRFLAVFHCSDADPVGPVRSARFVDPEIMLEYRPALLAYSGANPEVREKVSKTTGVTGLRHGEHADAFYRDKARRAPSNLFSSTDNLRDLEELRGPPESGFEFLKPGEQLPQPATSPGAPAAPGTSIEFSFGSRETSRYTFDGTTGAYLRSHGDKPHVNVKGEQLRATNVVVFKVRVVPGKIRDAAGNTSPEITVVGEGEAIVVRGGTSVTGTWKRENLDSRTRILDASGAPVKLLPGSTWIHLLPQERPVNLA